MLAVTARAQTVSGKVRWSGEVRLTEAVDVPHGATLTVAAGTRVLPLTAEAGLTVSGKLLIDGSGAAPVVFDAPPGWRGIQFTEGDAGSRIRYARFTRAAVALSTVATDFSVSNSVFSGCEVAIKLEREASPKIEDNLFADNDTGVANEMKSSPTIRNNRFSGHKKSAIFASHGSRGPIAGNRFVANQQGITLIQRYEGEITDNHFQANDTAIFCNQTQNTPRITNSRFEKNRVAVANVSFAYPLIENNQFNDNSTAIHNDQYGAPKVEHNLFRRNEMALYNYRKSNPVVHLNRFEGNQVALFCDFSSYPEVKKNDFLDNPLAVKLGIYQSADWEKRCGSKALMQQEAAARQTRNPMLASAPTEFTDVVDVSDNYWGKETAQIKAAGDQGNLTIFHDRHDQPEVSYEAAGFGPGMFRLDRVHYVPWLSEPVPGAGTKGKGKP